MIEVIEELGYLKTIYGLEKVELNLHMVSGFKQQIRREVAPLQD